MGPALLVAASAAGSDALARKGNVGRNKDAGGTPALPGGQFPIEGECPRKTILYILFIHVIQNSWIDRMRRIKRPKPMVKFKGDSTNSGPNH